MSEFKLVPGELTGEMRKATSHCESIDEAWRAMLAAAPQPPALGVESVQRFWAEEAQNIRCVRESDFDEQIARLQAELARSNAEVERLTAKIVELEKDKDRIDSLEANYWDVRHSSSPIADTGDHSTSIEIVGHWMDKPHERVIGENYNENLRAAIDQAMSADAYPPERPEYPEIDAALAEGKEHE